MNVLQTGKMLMKARQTQNKLKAITAVGKSTKGRVAVLINGLQEVEEVKLLVNTPSDFKSNKELETEVIEALKTSRKEIEKKLQQDMDVDSIKDMLGI